MASSTGLRPRKSSRDTKPSRSTAGSVKLGADSPGTIGDCPDGVVMEFPPLAEERQENQGVRIDPGPLADFLGQSQVALRLGLVTEIQVQRSKAIVAREHELWFAGGLDEAERLAVALERTRRIAVALIDLPEHDERHREVIELTELTIQLDGGLSSLDALGLATIRQGAIRNSEIGIQTRLHAEIADPLRSREPLEARGDATPRIERAVEDAQVGVAPTRGLEQALAEGDLDAALDVRDGLSRPVGSCERDPQRVARMRDNFRGFASRVGIAAVERA